MADIGPVEYMVVAFPGNKFRGEIAPALRDLTDNGIIRIIDLALVSKDGDGNVTAGEIENTDSDAARAFKQIEAEIGDLVNEDDLMAIGEDLDRDSSAAVLVWEDVWAAKLAASIAEADGAVLQLARVPRDVVEAALEHAGA